MNKSQPVNQNISRCKPLGTTGKQIINLNTADVKQLTHSVKGIGIQRASAIVLYRQTHGAYKSIQDLALVRGIGKMFVQAHLTQLQAVFCVS